jgi:hypothetical protein
VAGDRGFESVSLQRGVTCEPRRPGAPGRAPDRRCMRRAAPPHGATPPKSGSAPEEERTHERLKAHLWELVDPKIAEHHGRIVKNTGDGFLAEFPSVVDAVRCAVEVQRGMVERNLAVPPNARIEFRVGQDFHLQKGTKC